MMFLQDGQDGEASWKELLTLIRQRVVYCLAQHRALPVGSGLGEEIQLLGAMLGPAHSPGGTLGSAHPPGGMLPIAAWQQHLRLTLELLLLAAGDSNSV